MLNQNLLPKTENPLQKLYEQCTYGTMAEKFNSLPDFPRMLDVELTNVCNFRCVMCPTGQGSVKRSKGQMESRTLLKVLDEAMTNGTPIRYIRWGEPMLYKYFEDAIIETKQRGLLCHLNTNGSFLSREVNDFLVHVGLDSIKISFQGVNETGYSAMRVGGSYQQVLDNIRELHRIRTETKSPYPFIQIGTTIINETAPAIADFIASVDAFTDAVYIGRTKDLQEPNPVRAACECPEVFDKLSINWDGTVSACCGDYDNKMLVGDLRKQTLQEIWDSPELANYRMMLLAYRHNELPLCSRCARSKEE